MQQKERETSRVSNMQLTNDNSRLEFDLDRDKAKSFAVSILVLAALGVWIFLSYTYNLFIKESLICSAIIVGIMFAKASDQNRYLNHEK